MKIALMPKMPTTRLEPKIRAITEEFVDPRVGLFNPSWFIISVVVGVGDAVGIMVAMGVWVGSSVTGGSGVGVTAGISTILLV